MVVMMIVVGEGGLGLDQEVERGVLMATDEGTAKDHTALRDGVEDLLQIGIQWSLT